jgi:hypothetical protein
MNGAYYGSIQRAIRDEGSESYLVVCPFFVTATSSGAAQPFTRSHSPRAQAGNAAVHLRMEFGDNGPAQRHRATPHQRQNVHRHADRSDAFGASRRPPRS